MKNFLHPDFKLNGSSFSSSEELRKLATDLIGGNTNDGIAIGKFILEWLNEKGFISVNTSGSTGIPKTIKLQKKQVFNSANATASYFGLFAGTRALLCLSSEYIAGKMMLVRAMVSGWHLYTTAPEKNPLANFEIEFDFTAMVPYQVHHSLPELNRVKKLIVGGGAVSSKLESELQALKTEVFATYGMTETISHVAIRNVNGLERSNVYYALPEIWFSQNADGCLQIHAFSISEEIVNTNDVVQLFSPTSFTLLGRIDNVINTGGVKVHPETVEERLAMHIQQPFFIAAEKDETLGERVVLIVESKAAIEQNDFFGSFEALSTYERPKRILALPKFIYTETGKIRRGEVLKNLPDFKGK